MLPSTPNIIIRRTVTSSSTAIWISTRPWPSSIGEYLSQFHVQSVDSAIGRQTCPGSQVKTYPYGIATGEKTDHKTLHSLTYVIDDALDPTVAMAFKVLTYVLLQSPAAPLKKALVDAGLGKDISGDFQDGILQPLWGISVNGSDPDKQAQILPLVRKVLSDMVRSGLDRPCSQAP